MARRPRSAAKIPDWMTRNLPAELVESTLFRFAITLPDGRDLELDLPLDIDLDYELLEQQLEDCPAQYVYYAAVYSELKHIQSVMERKVKARRGRCVEMVTELARDSNLRMTNDHVKLVAEKDNVLNRLEEALAETQKVCGKVYYMVEAMRMKSEHLRSLAGFKRQEREAQR